MIRNLTKGTELSGKEFWAVSLFSRMRGLIGHDFSRFDGMVFPDCNGIHTFFMGMKIDVVFVNKENKVLGVYSAVRRWKPCLIQPGASMTIELPVGTIERTRTETGDHLLLKKPENSAILLSEKKI